MATPGAGSPPLRARRGGALCCASRARRGGLCPASRAPLCSLARWRGRAPRSALPQIAASASGRGWSDRRLLAALSGTGLAPIAATNRTGRRDLHWAALAPTSGPIAKRCCASAADGCRVACANAAPPMPSVEHRTDQAAFAARAAVVAVGAVRRLDLVRHLQQLSGSLPRRGCVCRIRGAFTARSAAPHVRVGLS